MLNHDDKKDNVEHGMLEWPPKPRIDVDASDMKQNQLITRYVALDIVLGIICAALYNSLVLAIGFCCSIYMMLWKLEYLGPLPILLLWVLSILTFLYLRSKTKLLIFFTRSFFLLGCFGLALDIVILLIVHYTPELPF